MKKPLIVSAAILLLISTITLTACGHHRHHDPMKRAEWIVEEIADHLDLNEVQLAKLNDIKTTLMSHRERMHSNKADIMNRLMAEIQKPEMDPTFLMSIVEQKQQTINELAPEVIDKLVVFHASLNNEQKQEVLKKIQKHQKFHQL